MNEQLLKNIRKIEPYVPGEQPENKDIIKLNTDESPYPPSPNISKMKIDFDDLRLYPNFKCEGLKNVLADIYNIHSNQIFLGNGSDEVLAFCFMAFFNSEKPILFADITYSFYDVWCRLFNIKYKTIPLDDNFNIVKEDYYQENGGIVIANPNAPTSICMDLDEIEDILKNNQESVVLIDEAYIDFGGESAVKLIDKYKNLVVVQTFSKSRSLAGLRIGYAMGNVELIQAIDTIKNSFNSYTVDMVCQMVAEESAKDTEYFNECTSKIIKTREKTIKELEKLGFCTLPSKTNFIFTTNDNVNAEELFQYLKSKNILIRYFKKPKIDKYLRITIGLESEMEILLKEINNFLNNK